MSKKTQTEGHVAPVSNAPASAETPTQQPVVTVLGKHLAGNAPKDAGHIPEGSTGAIVTYTETEFSLVFPEELSEAQFLTVAKKIGEAASGLGWRVGDLANFGKEKFSYKDYEKLAEITGFAEVYLRTCSSIAVRVPYQFRNLASMERFRLILAMPNENLALPADAPKDAVAHVETLPEKIKRLQDWTAAELRNKQRSNPKTLGDGTTSGVPSATQPQTGTTQEGTSDAPNADAGETAPQSDSQPPTGGAPSSQKPEPVVTATRIHTMLGEIHDAVQAMGVDRLSLFAVIEEKSPRLPQTIALLKLLRDQVRTELNKPS